MMGEAHMAGGHPQMQAQPWVFTIHWKMGLGFGDNRFDWPAIQKHLDTVKIK
jgi:hypothetical protein